MSIERRETASMKVRDSSLRGKKEMKWSEQYKLSPASSKMRFVKGDLVNNGDAAYKDTCCWSKEHQLSNTDVPVVHSSLTLSVLSSVHSEPVHCPLVSVFPWHVKRSFIHSFNHHLCKSYNWMKTNKSLNKLLRQDLWV